MEDLLAEETIGIDEIKELKRKAYQARARIVQMVYDGGSGHCGGSLSIIDILAVLYFIYTDGLFSQKILHYRP